MGNYRPNVAALILNKKGRLLVCERVKSDGAWQFPQGGVDDGETALEALFREVWEEVGLRPECYDVIEYREGYRYEFPPEKSDRKGFVGQEQTYFLCQLHDDAPEPDVTYEAKEFQDYKWIKKKHFERKWVPKFKRKVYEQVMWDFFGKELKDD